jgi:hypothetical protein
VENKLRPYETVTYLPVIVPSKIFQGKEPGGKQTFLVYDPPLPTEIRRKSDPRPIDAPISNSELQVVVLRWSDLSPKSRVGARLWKAVGDKAQRELTYCLQLYSEIKTPTSTEPLATLYLQLGGKIWYDEEADGMGNPQESSRLGLGLWQPVFTPHARSARSKDFARTMERAGKHHTVLAGIVSSALSRARLVLWKSKHRFIPAIFCDNLESAVYALALPMFAGGQSLGVCEWCKQMFLKARVDQHCCCTRHADNARVTRWRAEKRSKRK